MYNVSALPPHKVSHMYMHMYNVHVSALPYHKVSHMYILYMYNVHVSALPHHKVTSQNQSHVHIIMYIVYMYVHVQCTFTTCSELIDSKAVRCQCD